MSGSAPASKLHLDTRRFAAQTAEAPSRYYANCFLYVSCGRADFYSCLDVKRQIKFRTARVLFTTAAQRLREM